jgi:hypothetical protein
MTQEITINVNGTEMSLAQAKELYEALKPLFDKPSYPFPVHPPGTRGVDPLYDGPNYASSGTPMPEPMYNIVNGSLVKA